MAGGESALCILMDVFHESASKSQGLPIAITRGASSVISLVRNSCFCINNTLVHHTTRHSARLIATTVLINDVKTFGDVFIGASHSTIRWSPPESSRLVDPVLIEKNRKGVGDHLTRWPMKSVRASALVRGVLHVSSRLDAPRSNSTPQSSPKTN